ncbi:hypothetical protein IAT38_001509 [Cryptococcus sp. DSM 104549]
MACTVASAAGSASQSMYSARLAPVDTFAAAFATAASTQQFYELARTAKSELEALDAALYAHQLFDAVQFFVHPSLPSTSIRYQPRKAETVSEYVEQWYNPDFAHGQLLAVRHWPVAWQASSMFTGRKKVADLLRDYFGDDLERLYTRYWELTNPGEERRAGAGCDLRKLLKVLGIPE